MTRCSVGSAWPARALRMVQEHKQTKVGFRMVGLLENEPVFSVAGCPGVMPCFLEFMGART